MTNEELDRLAEKVVNKLVDSRYPESKINELIDKKFSEDTRLTMLAAVEDRLDSYIDNLVFNAVHRQLNYFLDNLQYDPAFINSIRSVLNNVGMTDSGITSMMNNLNNLKYEMYDKYDQLFGIVMNELNKK